MLRRAGATEASVELAKLAGLTPIGLSAAIPSRSLESLRAFADKFEIPVSSTADLVAYVRRREMLVERCGPPAQMPTRHGRFVAHTYRSRLDGTEHAYNQADPRNHELVMCRPAARDAVLAALTASGALEDRKV